MCQVIQPISYVISCGWRIVCKDEVDYYEEHYEKWCSYEYYCPTFVTREHVFYILPCFSENDFIEWEFYLVRCIQNQQQSTTLKPLKIDITIKAVIVADVVGVEALNFHSPSNFPTFLVHHHYFIISPSISIPQLLKFSFKQFFGGFLSD